MKKKLLLLCLICVFTLRVWAQDQGRPFITEWIVNGGDSVTIGLNTERYYDFNYLWKSADGITVAAGTHTSTNGDFVTFFNRGGTHTLEITGTFPHFREYPKEQLSDVLQWGDIAWETMYHSFLGWNGTGFSALDAPNLTNVSNMRSAFRDASSFNADLSQWNVSNVSLMSKMLDNTALSIQNYDKLLTSWSQQEVQQGVTLGVEGLMYCDGREERSKLANDFGWLIEGDAKCNRPFITLWTVESGQTIPIVLNEALDDEFNLTFGLNLAYDFDYTWKADDGTVVSAGTHTSLDGLFETTFTNGGEYTLEITGSFAHFQGYPKDQLLDVLQWGGIEWETMALSFRSWPGSSFSAEDTPDLTNVKSLALMFREATNFNGDISHWDVSNIRSMASMFEDATSFNQDLAAWETGNVEDFTETFFEADHFEGDGLSEWDISSASEMDDMLSRSNVTEENYDLLLTNWSQQAVQPGITLGAGGRSYCQGEIDRNRLINEFGWTILGDAKCPAFVTTWEVEQGNEISIGLNPDFTYNFDYVWRDSLGVIMTQGNHTSSQGAFITQFSAAGIFTLEIAGEFPHLINDYHNGKLLDVKQWGTIQWKSFHRTFQSWSGSSFSANDTPDLRLTTDMSRMFNHASTFNGDLNSWDVGNVKNMSYMFEFASRFNQPLNQWNVSAVTNMRGMFRYTEHFDQPLNDWDVGNVEDMSGMFSQTEAFNKALNAWDVKRVKDMSYMFSGAEAFNKRLDKWEVDSVTNMSVMFFRAPAFNRDLNTWNVENVVNMYNMFALADSFNGNVSDWNVKNVVNMGYMFLAASSFNRDLGSWNVKKVENMDRMLEDTNLSISNYDKTLQGWSQQNVKEGVELGAHTLIYCEGREARDKLINEFGWNIVGDAIDTRCKIPFITSWEVANGQNIRIGLNEDFTYDFYYTWRDAEGDVFQEGYHTSAEGAFKTSFSQGGIFTLEITGEFPHLTNSYPKNRLRDVKQWGEIQWRSFHNTFATWTRDSFSAEDQPDLSLATDLSYMFSDATNFNGNINKWNVGAVEDMSRMFKGALSFNKPLNNWDVGQVKNMSSMFLGAHSFNQYLDNWDVRQVKNMNSMFQAAIVFDQNLGSWELLSIEDMGNMFVNTKLSTVNYDEILMGWVGWDDSIQRNVRLDAFGFGNNSRPIHFCHVGAQISRRRLIDVYGWSINDDGRNCVGYPFSARLATQPTDTLSINATQVSQDLWHKQSVYPNPTDGYLAINTTAMDTEPAKVLLYTMNGQLMPAEITNDTDQLHVSFEGPKGIYLLHVLSGSELKVYKIVKE